MFTSWARSVGGQILSATPLALTHEHGYSQGYLTFLIHSICSAFSLFPPFPMPPVQERTSLSGRRLGAVMVTIPDGQVSRRHVVIILYHERVVTHCR